MIPLTTGQLCVHDYIRDALIHIRRNIFLHGSLCTRAIDQTFPARLEDIRQKLDRMLVDAPGSAFSCEYRQPWTNLRKKDRRNNAFFFPPPETLRLAAKSAPKRYGTVAVVRTTTQYLCVKSIVHQAEFLWSALVHLRHICYKGTLIKMHDML